MTMRKRAGSVLFTAAAAAALMGMSVVPALASTHLTVKVSGGGSYRAAAKTTVLTDGIAKVTCSSSKASGKLANGTHRGAAPVKVGTAAKLSFSNCQSAAGAVTTTIHSTPYAVAANSKTNRKGFTDAIISGTNVTVTATACSFTVTGSASGYFSNKTHQLIITPKLPIKPVKRAQLTVSNVSVGNCGGLVHNGDHPTFTATYKVSLKHLKITSR
jgi:hypothetical protein